MHDALVATGRPVVFDVNDAMQAEQDWTWAPPIANLWRVTGDVADTYNSMVNHLTEDVTNSADDAAGGGWNDPDML
jgi:alpha-galactosidase